MPQDGLASHKMMSIKHGGTQVVWLKLRIVLKNLFLGCALGDKIEDHFN